MGEPASLRTIDPTALTHPRGAIAAVPRRQGTWLAVQILTAGILALTGLWASQPSLALAISLGAGVSLINPRKWWAVPLVIAAVSLSGLAFDALRWPAVLGAGATAGVFAAWLLPEPTDLLDAIHGGLGTAAGAAIGLWAAVSLLPATSSILVTALVSAAAVALVSSQGLVPLALRFDYPSLPSRGKIKRTLQLRYRDPVFKAFDLFRSTKSKAPDTESRRGLAEIATWVYRLQVTLQTLDRNLDTIDPVSTRERIRSFEEELVEDAFTRDRRQATATHLRRLLDHREAIAKEHHRTEALVDYALAFLEEARAGLAVAQTLPGESSPDRLREVLHRLRTHAADGNARRATARELQQM